MMRPMSATEDIRKPATARPDTTERAALDAEAEQRFVSRWAIHRRLYIWVLSWAHRKHSTTALFLLAFAESSFFPIPPDVLQIALTLERRNRAFFYATVSAIGSVVGGCFGYLIGWGLWDVVSDLFFSYIPGFTPELYDKVHGWYDQYNFWIIFIAAFTPIPYKIFTITAGVFGIFFPMFVIASAVGRAGRFFLVALLLWKYGPPIRTFIDRYFNMICIAIAVLLVGGFVLWKALH